MPGTAVFFSTTRIIAITTAVTTMYNTVAVVNASNPWNVYSLIWRVCSVSSSLETP